MGGDPQAFPSDLLSAWEDASWPGNVRELRNLVARRLAVGELEQRRAVEVTPAEIVDIDDTLREAGPGVHTASQTKTDLIDGILAENLPLVRARDKLLRAFEARYVAHTLAQHGGNVTKAAAASGVARRHFQRVKRKANEPHDG